MSKTEIQNNFGKLLLGVSVFELRNKDDWLGLHRISFREVDYDAINLMLESSHKTISSFSVNNLNLMENIVVSHLAT